MYALQKLAEITYDDFLTEVAARVVENSTTNNDTTQTDTTPELITASEALRYTGKGATDLWAGIKSGTYPAPVTLPGKARRWRKQDWQQWHQRNVTDWHKQ